MPTLLPGSSGIDRKSTRLNSSHVSISYAVFCLKKTTVKSKIRRSFLHGLLNILLATAFISVLFSLFISFPLAFIVAVGLFAAFVFFFFNDTAPTEIYTLSLHDALPISVMETLDELAHERGFRQIVRPQFILPETDRKSTRLNSSHVSISYAVFCLK